MSRRLRAAIEAMPHEHPRLGAVAIGTMNGADLAVMLDRPIERSGNAREVSASSESTVTSLSRRAIESWSRSIAGYTGTPI
jgi:hypothetical protein